MSHTSLSTETPPNMRFQPTASLACARFAAAEARAVGRPSGLIKPGED